MIVHTKDNKVLLTFDDGPSEYLGEILSILRNNQVQAVFFWQSNLINQNTAWQKVLSEGHLIGSHAHSHPKLTDLMYEEQFLEIQKSKETIENVTSMPVKLFRPPYGLYNQQTHDIIKKFNLEMMLWKVASWDWIHEKDVNPIIENVVENVSEGDIVLLHELPQTCRALPKIIEGIRGKGLTLASL